MIIDGDREWYFACKTSQLTVGKLKQVKVYDTDVLLIRVEENQIVAMEPWCPHNGAPLVGGKVDCGLKVLTCAEHAMEIDLKTGANTIGPYGSMGGHYERCLQFSTKVENDRIYVRLKTPAEIEQYFRELDIPFSTRPSEGV